jgi:hypothetical protein
MGLYVGVVMGFFSVNHRLFSIIDFSLNGPLELEAPSHLIVHLTITHTPIINFCVISAFYCFVPRQAFHYPITPCINSSHHNLKSFPSSAVQNSTYCRLFIETTVSSHHYFSNFHLPTSYPNHHSVSNSHPLTSYPNSHHHAPPSPSPTHHSFVHVPCVHSPFPSHYFEIVPGDGSYHVPP